MIAVTEPVVRAAPAVRAAVPAGERFGAVMATVTAEGAPEEPAVAEDVPAEGDGAGLPDEAAALLAVLVPFGTTTPTEARDTEGGPPRVAGQAAPPLQQAGDEPLDPALLAQLADVSQAPDQADAVPRRRPGPGLADGAAGSAPADPRIGPIATPQSEPQLDPGLRRGTAGEEAAVSLTTAAEVQAERPDAKADAVAPSDPAASLDTAAQPLPPSSIDAPRPAHALPTPAPQFDPTHLHLAAAREAAWLDGLARDIAGAAAPDGSARFAVSPERLGEVAVELSRGEDGTAVRLSAATERAHALLADAAPRLEAEARAAGVRISETSIDLAGRHGGQPPARHAAPPPLLRTAAQAAPASPPRTVRAAAQDRYA